MQVCVNKVHAYGTHIKLANLFNVIDQQPGSFFSFASTHCKSAFLSDRATP